MSGPNARFALPPGERPPSDAQLPLEDSPPMQGKPIDEALPGAVMNLDVISRVLNSAAEAMSELHFARAQNDWPAFEAAAKQLAAALRPDPLALARNLTRTIQAERPREKSHQAKE